MVGVGGSGSRAGDGSRRRLPSWMAGVNVNKSDGEGLDRNSNSNSNSKEPADIVGKSETTRRPRRRKSTQRHQEEEEEEEGGEINVTGTQKKRKVREPAPPKKRRKLKQITHTRVDQIEDDDNTNGDEEEEEEEEQLTLTVEDLLSIAKEYVQADGERGEVQSSSRRELESEKELLASTSLENRDILNQKLSTDSAMGSMSEQSLVSVSRTGDPAQDMLDLFLGPLLKKPVEDQNRTKFTANDIFDIEFRKLSETQKNDAGQEHTVASPVMKKKSSLKDKVAVLLD
ncbi:hypothetical protein KPL70_012401 [Citrus sinensis]|uniref:uncharacterized protein LOC102616411 n=1 Tax=Citrus sinensis TaxID=2711 RepID=UPI0003D779D6|nr:uncharacterized protein LOC102616411 [Citrus sinensis]KAH9706923.1 hypothetical protein KPL70_012401 [Citrus sinensis]GAY43320.1 hypothetical protein CUMW_073580 [Citrus unshiu]